MALASACLVVHAATGHTNKSLRGHVAGLLGTDYTASQMSYDLAGSVSTGSSSASPAPTLTQ